MFKRSFFVRPNMALFVSQSARNNNNNNKNENDENTKKAATVEDLDDDDILSMLRMLLEVCELVTDEKQEWKTLLGKIRKRKQE
jgi:hypothetical protein